MYEADFFDSFQNVLVERVGWTDPVTCIFLPHLSWPHTCPLNSQVARACNLFKALPSVPELEAQAAEQKGAPEKSTFYRAGPSGERQHQVRDAAVGVLSHPSHEAPGKQEAGAQLEATSSNTHDAPEVAIGAESVASDLHHRAGGGAADLATGSRSPFRPWIADPWQETVKAKLEADTAA